MNLTEVTDLSVIGTLFAFTIVCAGVLIKDKEFAGTQRFVPYISSAIIGPVIFVIVLYLIILGSGVAVLDAKYSAIKDGTYTGQITAEDRANASQFDAY